MTKLSFSNSLCKEDFGVLGRKILEPEFLWYHRQPSRQEALLNVGLSSVILPCEGYITSLIFGLFHLTCFTSQKQQLLLMLLCWISYIAMICPERASHV